MGNYTRANEEFVLLGMRGRLDRVSAGVRCSITAPNTGHSCKPPEVRDRIVQLFGDIPRIELFARDKAPGWEATGLEFDKINILKYEAAK
jgi:site-specific DNA-methyltransferase (adenine-specific)